MINSITLDTTQLAAILCFVAKKTTRYYLQGVCIDVTAAGVRLVATDGRAMGVIKSIHDCDYDGIDTQIIIPCDVVTTIVKMAGRGALVTLVGVDGSVSVDGLGLTFKPRDARYPDWRRVITAVPDIPDDIPQFDVELLARFRKAAKLLGCRMGYVYLMHMHGSTQVQLPASPLFSGIVKPLQMPDGFTPVDAWQHHASFV